MVPNFQVISVEQGEGNKFSIQIIIVDDDKYIGYIFTFKDVTLTTEADGVGVFYDLVIDFHKGVAPLTIDEDKSKNLEDVGYRILQKIMSDLVDAVNSNLDSSSLG